MEENQKSNASKFQEKFGKMVPSFKFNFSLKNLPQRIIHTLREYRRVILVSKKPDIDELSKISKVAGIGILIIGSLGFILQSLAQLLK